jgi:hypothetical protein
LAGRGPSAAKLAILTAVLTVSFKFDLQIPCGSLLAKNIVENSIQSKMSMESVLKLIAPVDEKFEQLHSASANHNTARLVGPLHEEAVSGKCPIDQGGYWQGSNSV